MDDSMDELQRSQDRLFPPSSPMKVVSLPEGLGSPAMPKRKRQASQSPTRQRQSFLIDTPIATSTTTRTSPMRIRVTVEAEPPIAPMARLGASHGMAQDFDNGTTTITIPLKGEDEHKPVRRRGRPMKSLDSIAMLATSADDAREVKETPKPRSKAAGTPAKKRQTKSAEKKKKNDVTAGSNTTPTAPEGSEQPIAKRTRRSMLMPDVEESTPVQEPKQTKPRRTFMDFANITPLHQKKGALDVSTILEPIHTPWGKPRSKAESATKKIRERVPTPRKPKLVLSEPVYASSSLVADESILSRVAQEIVPDNVGEGLQEDEEQQEQPEQEQEEFENLNEDQEESEELGEAGDYDGGNEDDFGDGAEASDEGMTGLEDDTTMLDRSAVESEGFSMVSIDSLRDQRRLAEKIGNRKMPESKLRIQQSIAEEFVEEVGETEPPPENQASAQRTRSPAGPSPRRAIKAREGSSIFDGFGTGTRRQLQARLEIGQMLAGEEHISSSERAPAVHFQTNPQSGPERYSKLPTPADSEDAHDHDARKPLPRRSPRRSNTTQWEDKQPSKTLPQAPITPSTSQQDESFGMGHTQLYQQEIERDRQQVIQQAQAANTSQVVFIEGTVMADDEGGQDCSASLRDNQYQENSVESESYLEESHLSHRKQSVGQAQQDSGVEEAVPVQDMWLEEADRSLDSSLIARPSRRTLKLKAGDQSVVRPQDSLVPDLNDLFQVDTGPPRAKIPRTWRRVSGAGFLYSDENASPERLAPKHRAEIVPTQDVPPTAPEVTQDLWLDTRSKQREEGRAARAKRQRQMSPRRSPPKKAPTPKTAPAASPPKRKVMTAQPIVSRPSASDEQYFSESKVDFVNNSREDEAQLKTAKMVPVIQAGGQSRLRRHDELIHQSIEDDTSIADTSDARQLQQELYATTPRRRRTARLEEQQRRETSEQQRLDSVSAASRVLLRKPGKVYAPLFTDSTSSAVPLPAIRNQNIQSRPTTTLDSDPFPTTSNDLAPFRSSSSVSSQSSIFNRLTSWLFSPSSTNTPSTTWNRNHYLLLDHYFTRITADSSSRLPAAYMTPWSQVPPSLKALVGVTLTTNEGRYPRKVDEMWVRIAWCFVDAAAEPGVPVLCDGRFAPGTGDEAGVAVGRDEKGDVGREWSPAEGGVYPVRDEVTGRVKRVRQAVWSSEEGANEVVERVYSLWVRDVHAGRARA